MLIAKIIHSSQLVCKIVGTSSKKLMMQLFGLRLSGIKRHSTRWSMTSWRAPGIGSMLAAQYRKIPNLVKIEIEHLVQVRHQFLIVQKHACKELRGIPALYFL